MREGWAESFQEEVFRYWKWGFRVFYGPVFPNPDLLILGFQPGGGPEDFLEHHLDRYERGDFSVPQEHEYLIENYRIARQMRDKVLNGNKNILENSIKSNIIFFRAPDISRWENLPDEKKQIWRDFH